MKYAISTLCLFAFSLLAHSQTGRRIFLEETGLVYTEESIYKSTGQASPAFYKGILPSKLDLSASLPPVGYQIPQKSCVGWALGYACRSYYNLKQPALNKASKQSSAIKSQVASPAFIYNILNNGQDNGITIWRALHLMMDTGACSFLTMPYNPKDYKKLPSAKAIQEAEHFRIDTFQTIDLRWDPVMEIKAHLVTRNPVICSVVYDRDYFASGFGTNEKYYIWNNEDVANTHVGHAIVIVGYDDAIHAFKFINSFGTGWGNNGYGWISYKLVKVIREAYVIKPKIQPGINPHPIKTTRDPMLTMLSQVDSFSPGQFEKASERLLNLCHQAKSGVLINDHQIIHDKATYATKELIFRGFSSVKGRKCTKSEVVVRFFLSTNGAKGAPIMSADTSYKLANGQVAAHIEAVLREYDDEDFDIWKITIPLSAFEIPKGKMLGSVYEPVTTKIIAEPVLFADDFSLATGNDFEVEVKY